MRILLRSSAARYNGKMRGPKDSIKLHSDEAGWNGARDCREEDSGGIVTVASLLPRFDCGSSIFEASKGESRTPADSGSPSWILWISQ